jgi:hypothetical protein
MRKRLECWYFDGNDCNKFYPDICMGHMFTISGVKVEINFFYWANKIRSLTERSEFRSSYGHPLCYAIGSLGGRGSFPGDKSGRNV